MALRTGRMNDHCVLDYAHQLPLFTCHEYDTPERKSPSIDNGFSKRHESYWRNIVTFVIRDLIAQFGCDDDRALRKALLEAYPFGEIGKHPYNIWCDEITRKLAPRLVIYHQRPLFDPSHQ